MRNENGLLTSSIPIIISYDAIFSNKWLPVTCWLVFSTVLDWFQTGSRLVLQMAYCLITAKKKLYLAFG